MFAIHEVALLIAVAVPVCAVVGLNLWLFVFGERGTLMLPQLGRFPAIAFETPDLAEDGIVDQGIVVVEEEPLRKAA